MAEAAMFTWILAAIAGLVMFSTWVGYGGPGKRGHSRLPEPAVLSHLGLAAAGVVCWLVYLLGDSPKVAWAGFILAVMISSLGLFLFSRWSPQREGDEVLAEEYFPFPLVAAHGLFATAILVLTLLTALGVG